MNDVFYMSFYGVVSSHCSVVWRSLQHFQVENDKNVERTKKKYIQVNVKSNPTISHTVVTCVTYNDALYYHLQNSIKKQNILSSTSFYSFSFSFSQ